MNTKAFLTIAISSLLILGFAAPASGATLTNGWGEPVEVGTKVTAASNNLFFNFGGWASTSCGYTAVNVEVTENAEQATLDQLGAATTWGCTRQPTGIPIIFKDLTFGTITLAEGAGSASLKFTEDWGGAGVVICSYTGTVTFSYEAETNVLSIPGSLLSLKTNSVGCLSGTEASVDFTLTDEEGEPIAIN